MVKFKGVNLKIFLFSKIVKQNRIALKSFYSEYDESFS